MELSTIKSLLELAGGPAFALEQGVIRFADPKAADLGLKPGTPLSAVLPDAAPQETGEEPVEASVFLAGQNWTLRALAASGIILCFLRPLPGRIPAPNERTLIHTAGSIRMALQDLVIALDSLSDTVCEDPAAAEQASLALRSVYRLRRTAGDLELLAALCAGTYRLCRQDCRPVSATAELCAEM
ncbi:MAG: hypothetical protein J5789_08405, partial [Oscillospiraceae bacterium]|nr:hypothetical protein [Oscillospiraceae bacterium]